MWMKSASLTWVEKPEKYYQCMTSDAVMAEAEYAGEAHHLLLNAAL